MNIFRGADILLPKDQDLYRWAVIACDQFTSDAAYWRRVRQIAGEQPSTIHMILPEAELEGERKEKVAAINAVMDTYLSQDVFQTYPNAYIYVERTLLDGSVRPGLVGMVDLESYDYNPGSTSEIRATEKTVLERIPPRQEVRRDATLEFPHVLMLCDDDQRCLIEPITEIRQSLPLLYDFDLMEDGGHISGYLLSGEAAADFEGRFRAYSQTYADKYRDLDGARVLLAVGDGNHSLATAKSCYEELKRLNPDQDLSIHPARYALVELENIHDPSLQFEPIHRILTGVDPQGLLAFLKPLCAEGGFCVPYVVGDCHGELYLDRAKGELAVAILQNALDDYLATHSGEIDYIHGDAEVAQLAQQENAVGFLLPAMEKGQLFRGVISGGVLPRKTFSMGHAREKRYYLEGRKIK